MFGTQVYMAPEMPRGEAHTVKLDVYSLGITMRHFLLGRPPMGEWVLPDGLDENVPWLIEQMIHDDPASRLSLSQVLASDAFGDHNFVTDALHNAKSKLKDVKREAKEMFGDIKIVKRAKQKIRLLR